jgi:hypothetical protein
VPLSASLPLSSVLAALLANLALAGDGALDLLLDLAAQLLQALEVVADERDIDAVVPLRGRCTSAGVTCVAQNAPHLGVRADLDALGLAALRQLDQELWKRNQRSARGAGRRSRASPG